MNEIEKLSDVAAVNALSSVVTEWSNHRGLESLVIILQTQHRVPAAFEGSPDWAKGVPQASPEAGVFSRRMLRCLDSGTDDEVIAWTRLAVKAQFEAAGHVVDPLSLSIIGGIIIGGILAARVKKIGSVEFYEGVPKELADVMKAGASIAPPSG